ncbi:MAG: MBL fold metallo-hydrolase, partial [Spartobacteria bacterium]
MKFINLTRRTEIGANSYYLEVDGHALVIDSGMHPKFEGEEALPNWKAIADRQLEAILVSHSHQDHIGTLPVLMRRQPSARVFMPEATGDIGDALLHNSVNVMTRQREELGTTLYPLFTHRETERAVDLWQFCPMRQQITIAGERASRGSHELTFEFFEAGHVLGAAGILLRARERTIFYTADVNFDDQTIMQAAAFPEDKSASRTDSSCGEIDILIMECTRGDHA